MDRVEVEQEFRKIDLELRFSRPHSPPYPPHVVKRRQLLLYAQVHLAEISWAQKCRDSETEEFHTEAYYSVMFEYCRRKSLEHSYA